MKKKKNKVDFRFPVSMPLSLNHLFSELMVSDSQPARQQPISMLRARNWSHCPKLPHPRDTALLKSVDYNLDNPFSKSKMTLHKQGCWMLSPCAVSAWELGWLLPIGAEFPVSERSAAVKRLARGGATTGGSAEAALNVTGFCPCVSRVRPLHKLCNYKVFPLALSDCILIIF